MAVLRVWTVHDGLLACVAPLGLAAAVSTALVVDLDPEGPAYPGSASLADLVSRGPRLSDLQPQRVGLAVLRNGGISDGFDEVVEALAQGWPHLVLREPTGNVPTGDHIVPVVPALPGPLSHPSDRPHVSQRTGLGATHPEAVVSLPRLSRSSVMGLLSGTVRPRSRWVRAWKPVWEMVW